MLNGRSQKAANIDQTEELLRQYRTLTEVIPQIVWTAKPDGNVDYVNNRWYEFTGMDFEQTRDWGWQPALHPDDMEVVSLRWRESLTSGEPFEAEMRFRRTDGVYHDQAALILLRFAPFDNMV